MIIISWTLVVLLSSYQTYIPKFETERSCMDKAKEIKDQATKEQPVIVSCMKVIKEKGWFD